MFFVAVIFVTSGIASFFLTRRLSDLIKRVDSDLERFIIDNEMPEPAKNDEFGKIDRKILELAMRIKEIYQKVTVYETEKANLEFEKKSLELDLLQARINPHFLYNTLSVIRFAFPDAKLAQLVSSMSKYYRIALNRGENVIKVSQEIEMARVYLEIQKFAYDSHFEYEIAMDENVSEKVILKHILQPAVENAFLHGVCSIESNGFIRIAGKLEEGKIIFTVTDNGIGIEQEKINKLLHGENISVYGGYGLRNTISRIETCYGGEYGLDIKQCAEGGTEVTITIPG